MTLSIRKFAAAVVAIGAMAVAGTNVAHAGILYEIQINGVDVGGTPQFVAGNSTGLLQFTNIAGLSLLQVQINTNFPGTPGPPPVGNLVTTVTESGVGGTTPVPTVTVNAQVNNGASQYDFARFTIPAGSNLFLNNDVTGNGGVSATSGTGTLTSIAYGFGAGANSTSLQSVVPIPGSTEVTSASPFVGVTGYALQNQVVVNGLNPGASLTTVTGRTSVSGGAALVPEPGTMAAALTGLLFVGGLGLRRRSK